MQNKRFSWRSGLIFLSGMALGGVGAAVFVARHWEHMFAAQYLAQVAGEAETAEQLYRGQGAALAEHISSRLPGYVEAVRSEWPEIEGFDWVLWQVSDVYQAQGQPPPAELREIFDKLPPRVSCRVPVGGSVADGR